MRPDRFVFDVSADRVHDALETMQKRLAASGQERALESIAEGFLQVANASMTDAIRQVSVAKGVDVRDYALVVFGGAAGQHAGAVARRLGIRTVLLHPYSGVLSAYGMGLADVGCHESADVGREELSIADVEPRFLALEQKATATLAAQGHPAETARLHRFADLRYRGTETAITMPYPASLDAPALRSAFEAEHARRFGYQRRTHVVEIVNVRVEAQASQPFQIPPPTVDPSLQAPAEHRTRVFMDGAWQDDVPVVWAETLSPGDTRDGPLLVLESTGTIVVERDFQLRMEAGRVIRLEDVAGPSVPARVSTAFDPVRLEVFNSLFMSVAEEMGVVLQRTALSTNIR
ncbi:MAG: hydantoinase/oxoprolinase family protein, partial [Planctomycetota bacterium]